MASFAEFTKKKKKQSLTGEMSFGDYTESLLGIDLDDIAPVRTTVEPISTVSAPVKKEEEDKLDFFQKGAFKNGYQFGDVTKSILGTASDAGVGVVKGVLGIGEGIKDLGQYGVAGVADLVGADKFADNVRKNAQKNTVEESFKGVDDYLDQYSVLGRTSDSITQGIGQVGTIILTGGIGSAGGLGAVGTTALTTGVMGVSSAGSGMSEAYRGGATDAEATAYGISKGVIDAGSELIFGGLGKAVGAIGLSKGISSLDDVFARKLSSKISNQVAKNVVEFGVKASGEGFEEIVAGAGSAVAKKLTYMDEEELGKIIEDENLLEQFIVGTVTSGMIQSGYIPKTESGSLKEANATGRDFITGYTQNEQSVIDKVVEERVKEQETDGKKLNKKEIGKIEQEVASELQKGYISVDTIESVLGGESFKAYNSLVEQENTLKKEIEALENMPNEKITVKENERLKQAREELNTLLEKSDKDGAKQHLTEEVNKLIENDTFLKESYNEKNRRSQQFEADLTKYDEKQQEVIKKAVDSGILNNTNKTHEFVDMIAKLSADKGVLFDFTNNDRLKESGFAIEGKTINGYVKDGNIALNINSNKALNTVVGHEITHVLEGTELYNELQTVITEYAKTKGDYDSRLEAITRLYEGVDNVNLENEITADLVGDYLFTDSNFINSLSTTKPNVFKKIYEEIKYFLKIATAGSKEAKELEQVKRAFDKAYKETANKTTSSEASMQLAEEATPIEMAEEVTPVIEKAEKVSMELTEEQKEYFKESKVRDENGNLKVMYHGTSKGGHTVFDPYGASKYGLFGVGSYFTDNRSVAESYTEKGKGNNKQIYETYLNITNPIDMDAQANPEAWKKALPEADFRESGTNEQFYRDMEEYLNDQEYPKWEAIEIAHDVIESMGYDGITHIGGGRFNKKDDTRHQVYIAFYPEQIKNIDNTSPTENADIRHSLSISEQGIAPTGKYNVYGKDIALETVSKKENVAPVVQEKTDLVQEVVQETDEYAPMTEAEANERDAMQSDRLYSLNESDMPDEVEAPYSEPVEAVSPFDDKDIQEVGDRKQKAYMYENPEVKPYFQEEAQVMLGELRNSVKGERVVDANLLYESNGEFGVWGTKRETSEQIAYMLDRFKYSYADIEKGLNAIIEDHGAENNAISKRLEFMIDERLREGYTDFLSGMEIPSNQDYINLLRDKQINNYSDEAYNQYLESLASEFANEDIAPTQAYEAIEPKPQDLDTLEAQWAKNKMAKVDSKKEAEEIAKILDAEPTTESKRNSRKWAIFKANVLDKGAVFEDLALKTKNRDLMGKWNYTLYSESRAQRLMGEGDAEAGVKSLNDIIAEVENTGLKHQFYEYVYHKHNVDRMSLEAKAGAKHERLKKEIERLKLDTLSEKQLFAISKEEIKDSTTPEREHLINTVKEYLSTKDVKNKPVFGYSVTAEMSQEIVDQYEFAQPEFMDFANDIYKYNTYLRQQLVDNGVISQETADLWNDMYPHYVPVRRINTKGMNINVPLDTGRTGVNAPIKGATGGNANILPLFDTMAMRTLQTYKATAKNSFGVELKNTLGTVVEKADTNVDEVIENIDAQEELLQEGKNGQSPTFTVFENGERVTYEITEDMYDAFKPLSDSSFMSKTIKPLNVASNFHRGLLTEYNPVFIITNGIKDIQDVLINSQHPARTYTKIPEAFAQLTKKGYWYNEYMNNGGDYNSYFDSDTNTFKTENKGLAKLLDKPPLSTISKLNNYVEMIPRLAEYIASREAGRSIEVSMLDSARVTTNFRAGGDLTKWANRNGATFLNASVQGAMQQVRNVREAKANGFKGWANLATKFALAGAPAYLLNALLWADDDEYEELSDYVKQNYYIVGKYDDGKFIRIPKGRTVAVIQDAIKQVSDIATGNGEEDLKSFLELVVTNLAPANPIESNILAPIIQVKNNETWYGEDLVPTRLQDLPASEQFDESTDAISKWLGEKLDISPVKINYLLDQYSGGVGDVVLPMLTPEAESGDNSPVGNAIAPFKKKFTVDSVMNNQNVSDFYDTSDELTTNAKMSTATDEDILMNKYINSVKGEMSDLYKQKREIQSSDLPDDVKYERVREIQSQIVELSKEGLKSYKGVSINGDYATIGDRHYKRDESGEWKKLTDKQLEKQEEVTSGLGISASDYWSNKDEYDFAYEKPEKYAISKVFGGYDAYKTYSAELEDIKADKDENGKTINGSRKEKVLNYVNNLDADYGTKIILFKSVYNADDDYNNDIIEYLNSRNDISYEEEVAILKELGFTVESDGTIYW